jgi:hypothetical protein
MSLGDFRRAAVLGQHIIEWSPMTEEECLGERG